MELDKLKYAEGISYINVIYTLVPSLTMAQGIVNIRLGTPTFEDSSAV